MIYPWWGYAITWAAIVLFVLGGIARLSNWRRDYKKVIRRQSVDKAVSDLYDDHGYANQRNAKQQFKNRRS